MTTQPTVIRVNAFNDIGISAQTNEACGTTSIGASTSPTNGFNNIGSSIFSMKG